MVKCAEVHKNNDCNCIKKSIICKLHWWTQCKLESCSHMAEYVSLKRDNSYLNKIDKSGLSHTCLCKYIPVQRYRVSHHIVI